eukprot:m.56843 g.56843  ORF g.56843 m.56843 type:complete len:482 (+) comp11065_c0_seq1:138-1583(+)
MSQVPLPSDAIRHLVNKDMAYLEQEGLNMRPVPAKDVETLAAPMEAASYPSDEAASLAQLKMRQSVAPQFFSGLYKEDTLVGIVVGTLCSGEGLKEETMSEHDPKGDNLCVHSVVVDAKYRRKGYGNCMLRTYVRQVAASHHNVSRITLICKAYLISFYQSCGFTLQCPSPVVHGADPWYEMCIDLTTSSTRQPSTLHVNAFCDPSRVRGSGNQAAVVFSHGPDGKEKSEETSAWMQSVAKDMNLSETAFLNPKKERNHFDLRWFTPAVEVDLCGHATLAAAHAAFSSGFADIHLPIKFHTLSGVLSSSRSDTGEIELDFPIEPVSAMEEGEDLSNLKTQLSKGTGLSLDDILEIGKNRIDLFLTTTLEAFEKMTLPDIKSLGSIETRGIVITCKGSSTNSSIDFQSRFLAPQCGIDEDPVTGSAHCGLMPLWAKRLGKDTLTGYQASPRGGTVKCSLVGDRVKLSGLGFITMYGALSNTN